MVNQVDKQEGINPLMCYLANDHTDTEVVKYLISVGTFLNQNSRAGKSALMIYIIGGYQCQNRKLQTEICKLLITNANVHSSILGIGPILHSAALPPTMQIEVF